MRIFFLFSMLWCFQVLAFGQGMGEDSLCIGQIKITGNLKTKSGIIYREMTFKEGDKFASAELIEQLERSRRNIMQSNLFIWVKAYIEYRGKEVDLEFEVKERLYLLPLPILYLADRSFNEWWYNRDHDFKRVVYGLQLNHSNLTGNGDVLKLKTYGGFIPYFELSYGRPYIDKRQRMGLRGGVFFSRQRSFAYRTWEDKLDFLDTELISRKRKGGYIEYNLRNGLYHFHTLYLGYTSLYASDSVLRDNPNYLGSSKNTLPYITLRYDYRFNQKDNAFYPLDGRVLNINISHFNLIDSHLTNHIRLGLEYFRFFPIGAKFFGDVRTRGQLSFPKKQLYPFVNGLGYKNTLVRGYELNVIDGQNYALFQSDLKYQLLRKTYDISRILNWRQFNSLPVGVYLRAFYDIGYIQNYHPEFSKSSLSNKILFGYGLGLDVATFYDTVFKLNYSINQSGFNKLYFGVQRSF